MLWPGPQASLDPQETVWLSAGCETRAWRDPVSSHRNPCAQTAALHLLCLSCPLTGNPGGAGQNFGGPGCLLFPALLVGDVALQAAPHMGPSVPVPGLATGAWTPSSGAGGPTAGGWAGRWTWLILEHPVPVRCVWLGWGRDLLLCTRLAGALLAEAWTRLSRGSLLLPWRPVPEPSRDKASCAGRTLRSPSL